jgi:hypothetical protein
LIQSQIYHNNENQQAELRTTSNLLPQRYNPGAKCHGTSLRDKVLTEHDGKNNRGAHVPGYLPAVMHSISDGPDGVDAGADDEAVTERTEDDTSVVVAPARLVTLPMEELVTPTTELLTAAP